MAAHDEAAHTHPASRDEWRRWLEEHHDTSPGVWVITYKKAAGKPGPTYEDLVLEALCFGWIDSRPGRVDDLRTKLYLSPRRTGSGWAASNKARVTALVEQGLMTPAGQAVIDAAKADGSWDALEDSESLTLPRELIEAFRRFPGSRREFDAFPPGVRKQLIFSVTSAKRPDTRSRRAEEIALKAQRGERAFQWRPKGSG
ncbi:MAG: hypothetical protein GC156_07900 [Actinomycetales bacterium]|nr:hypothetical protein [Actinomycetales bacterium]